MVASQSWCQLTYNFSPWAFAQSFIMARQTPTSRILLKGMDRCYDGPWGQKAQQIWLFKTVLMMIVVSAFLYGWGFLQVRIHQQAINYNLPRWHECMSVSRNDRFCCFLTWHRLTECETNHHYPSCLQLRSVCNSKRVNIYGPLRLPTVKQLTLTLRLWMLHGRPESPKLKAFVMRFPPRWSWYVSGVSKRGFHESTARAPTSLKERPMASKQ